MSSVSDQIECPKCGYEYADYTYICRIGNEFVSCVRCGFSGSNLFDKEKYKTTGEPDWINKEKGGTGSCMLKWKGQIGCTVEPIENIIMDSLKETLNEFEVCKYTFQKDGQWYVVDLLKMTEQLFTPENFWE